MPTFPQSFRVRLLKERSSQKYVFIALPLLILEITLFKFLYPYADFFSDSYSYIYAAMQDLKVNLWPIGYSKFILWFHYLSHSDTSLVVFQYLLIQGATLYFLLTVFYYWKPGVLVQRILFYVLMLNPLILYISNYISSDGIFLALSLVWVTQLIQILYRPNVVLLLFHSVIIFAAFTIRYNAMYYPLITSLVYVITKWKLSYKIIGIVLPPVLMGLFISYTARETEKISGNRQFSVFGGWQIANNAMYMLPHIRVEKTPPPACLEFHQHAMDFVKKAGVELGSISPLDGAFYLRDPHAPLKTYLLQKKGNLIDSMGGIVFWGAVSPIYSHYGKFLISSYPLSFTRYFLLPNTYCYFVPPLEKLEVYNLGSYSVFPIAAYWFEYPRVQIKAVSLHAQRGILFAFPGIFGALNLFFLWMVINWCRDGKIRQRCPGLGKVLLVVISLVLVNGCFSILASPIVLRYQIFPMILLLIFSTLLAEKMEWGEEKS
ncbi:hypothetical protein [Chryseobacterium sp. 22543]|uniref:hypothetical protein n=1 Tax=Chryseobacterium sp. 22543 TaxID=3453940 RepID=UPI003F86FF74